MDLKPSQFLFWCRSSPLTKKYWRLIRFQLCLVALWPREAVGEPRSRLNDYYSIYTAIQHPLLICSIIHYVWSNFEAINFFTLGHILITLSITTMTLTRLWLPFDKRFKNITATFFNSIHLANYDRIDEFSSKIQKQVEKYSEFLAYYLTGMTCLGVTLFTVTPIISNYRSGAFSNYRNTNITLDTSIFLTAPLLDYTRNINHWIVVSIYNFYVSSQGSFSICIIDIYFFLISFQVMGHIVIIEHNFINMKKPAGRVRGGGGGGVCEDVEKYSEEENREVRQQLITYLRHHNTIIMYVGQLNDCFENMLLLNYALQLVSGCILLLELMQGYESWIRYGPLSIILLGQLVMHSMIIENVGTLSDRLGDAVYSSPWPCMDVSNQKMVLLMLMRAQPPLKFKAKGLVQVGVQPMLAILKSTLSYYMFLRQRQH